MKALFLDRDGVINKDLNYVHKKEDIQFTHGIFKFLKKATKQNYKIIIITNQAGIGRGLYSEKDFWTLMHWMLHKFSKRGIHIEKVYFCPHHPTHGKGRYKKKCKCRKPNSLLFEKAIKDFKIDVTQSIMIGDKESDLVPAKKVGVSKLILLNNVNMSTKNEYIEAKSIRDISDNFLEMTSGQK